MKPVDATFSADLKNDSASKEVFTDRSIALMTKGLTKSYGSVRALRGVDLEVARGEIFGFLGPNGSGKTTTIRCLLDLIRPDGGTLRVLGINPQADPVAVRSRVGYLPGELSLDDNMTSDGVLRFFNSLRGGRGDLSFVRQIAERLDLDLKRPIKNLSKGNKQKVGIAQAFMHRPELLLLDEPTIGLDPLMQKEVLGLVNEARSGGATIFFSSHILEDAEVICDQVAIILSGRLVRQGYLDELLGQESVGAELVVEAIDEAQYRELASSASRAVEQGTRFLFEFADEADAEKALDRVRASGGRVRSLAPKRRSLEDVLLEGLRQESKR